ncbi:MAG TPA: spermidine synthase [Candidatus Nitrosotalea sp.]|nr:spermidine synthase [Candidatus Nitrosotalea sp.]
MESAPVAAVLGLDFLLLLVVLIGNRSSSNRAQSALVAGLFFCSGFPALIYQIVWQRALFAIYGVNVQSVAVVVSAFMLGLGLGSLAGGRLSARYPRHGIVIFGMCELGIAAFGLVSLGLFHWAARNTAGSGLAQTILFSLLLLIIPTMLMGATLPLLVEQLVRSSRSVGYSVATLYFVNTLGSAVACYACAEVLLRNLGQSGSVTLAACINTAVGATAFLYGRSERRKVETIDVADVTAKSSTPASSLGMAALIAGFAGFIALGFEIAWFRVFALATFDRAPAFALLLSAYLAGIAAGSFLSEKVVERKRVNTLTLAGALIVLAGAVSVYLPPLMAELSSRGLPVMFSVPAFFITAGLLGSVLPLLCQAAVSPDDSAGRAVSLIYLSNIVGSTLGSLGIGFVLMNYFGTEAISMELSAASVVIGAGVLFFQTGRLHAPSRWALGLIAVSVIAVPLSAATYSNLIGKLIFGAKAATVGEMKYVVENRNGIIAITPDDAVFGGGVYDGYFNIDPANDKNLVIRAYALSLLQARPKRVFMLGLASGSWAQVIANNPEVESLDVVEINPGYLQLVSRYSAVQSLLQNPKVHIYVDDARRWLVAHPDEKYDSIIANTSFHWRDHTSQVLSREYLAIVKSHLRPGGVYYYNATESPEVLVTGLHEFAYGMRVITFLAVSDSPFVLDKQRWMSVLNRYTIDGKRMFDPADSGTHTVLAAYSAFADTINQPQRLLGLEAGDALAQRLGPRHLITDDNMGAEWTEAPKPSWR